jgi:hypothetical protein
MIVIDVINFFFFEEKGTLTQHLHTRKAKKASIQVNISEIISSPK